MEGISASSLSERSLVNVPLSSIGDCVFVTFINSYLRGNEG